MSSNEELRILTIRDVDFQIRDDRVDNIDEKLTRAFINGDKTIALGTSTISEDSANEFITWDLVNDAAECGLVIDAYDFKLEVPQGAYVKSSYINLNDALHVDTDASGSKIVAKGLMRLEGEMTMNDEEVATKQWIEANFEKRPMLSGLWYFNEELGGFSDEYEGETINFCSDDILWKQIEWGAAEVYYSGPVDAIMAYMDGDAWYKDSYRIIDFGEERQDASKLLYDFIHDNAEPIPNKFYSTADSLLHEFEEGMTWGEWINSEYNTGDIIYEATEYEGNMYIVAHGSVGLVHPEDINHDDFDNQRCQLLTDKVRSACYGARTL